MASSWNGNLGSSFLKLVLVVVIIASCNLHLFTSLQRREYRDIDVRRHLPSKPMDPLLHCNISFHVLGERNSGTNFVTSLLQLLTRQDRKEYTHNLPTFVGGKHMFARDDYTLEQLAEIEALWKDNHAWVLAVREPCSWLDAMWRKPYHMCPLSKLNCTESDEAKGAQEWGRLPRDQFLWTSPFADYAHSRPFEDVFEVRSFKLKQMRRLMQALGPANYKVVHFPDAQTTPQAFLHEIRRQLLLPVAMDSLSGVIPKGFVKSSKKVQYPKKEYQYILEKLDWDLEAHFGFTREDCTLQP